MEELEQYEQRAAQGQGSGQWRSWSRTSSALSQKWFDSAAAVT